MQNRLAAALLIVFLTPLAWGQDVSTSAVPGAAPKTKAAGDKKDQRTTAINFEDELIEGEVKKPELLYLLQRKQFNFKRLIKLRENFLPEMNRTSEDIKQGRGSN